MSSLPILATAALCVNGALGLAYWPPIPADKSTPVQQRLMFADNGLSVGWDTYEKLAMPCVEYGTSTSNLTSKTCSNTSSTYATSRTWSHFVTLTGLTPDTDYYYKIVSTNSSVMTFRSAVTVGTMTPFNASVVVDLGVYGRNGYTTHKRDLIPSVQPELVNHSTIYALAQTIDEFDFVIHPGDFAYADDWYYNDDNVLSEEPVYQSIIESFYTQLQPITGIKPYMAAPGNHEAACIENGRIDHLCPVGQKNFTDFANRFGRLAPRPYASKSKNTTAVAMAKKAAALAVPPMWYSFEYGMAHVVMISTETDFYNAPDTNGSYNLHMGPFAKPGQQTEFLKADLASVDRSITPWVIVAGHRPWYSTGGYGNQCFACQDAFETIMYEYGVDLALFGHVHNSQRFNPLYKNQTDPAGLHNPKFPMYIVAGGAGNIEGLSPVGTNLTGNVFAYAKERSFARLSFESKNKLGVHFYNSIGNGLLDSSVLYKDHDVDFVRNSV